MPSEAFLGAQEMVKHLDRDLEQTRRNWAIFSESNGKTDSERASLRAAVGKTYAAHAFTYIQMSCATNALMALARMTDPRGADRRSLDALRGLIGPIQEEICNDALSWYSKLDYAGPTSKLAISARAEVAEKLPALISDIAMLLKSPEVARIRVLRNEALAHALTPSNIFPTYDDIECVFRKVSAAVCTASLVVCGKSWDPESFDEVSWTYAKEFWDVFEYGLIAMRNKGLL